MSLFLCAFDSCAKNNIVSEELPNFADYKDQNKQNDECIIVFDSVNGSETIKRKSKKGEKLKSPEIPVKEDSVHEYDFGGWYYVKNDVIIEWNFEIDVVQKDIVLYAKWIVVSTTTEEFLPLK